MGSDTERRALEEMAFGKPSGESDVAAARDALRQLVADDSSAAAPVAAPAEVIEVEPTEVALPAPHSDDDLPQPRSRRLTPLIAIGAFIAVFAIGFSVGRVVPGIAGHRPDPSASLFARFAPSTTFQRVPTASAKAALAELAKPQTPADILGRPDLTNTLGIETTSIHRILQVQGGLTLWAGRTTSAICLIFTGGSPASVGIGASCATPKEFNQNGLEIQENGYAWTWDGTTFGTTVATVIHGP